MAWAVHLARRMPSVSPSVDGAVIDHVVDRAWLARGWLRLRWIAVVGAAGVVAAALGSGHVPPEAGPALWGGVLGLAVFNALLWTRPAATLAATRGLGAQILGDAALLAWLLHHAGGLSNPFAPFFVFHAAAAGVLLPRGAAARASTLLAGIVGTLAALEATGTWPPGPLLEVTAIPSGATLAARGGALALTVLASGLLVSALVAALRRERTQVATEREQLQRVVDCMADAVLFVTPDGQIRLRNAAAAQLWPADAGPEPDLRQCHPPERWDALMALLARTEPLTVHPVLEVRGRHFEASWAHVLEPGGASRGVVMVARDITERVERQRSQMREERMATVGKLAAGLAHELNNPLGAISLFSQHALSSLAQRPDDPLVEHLGTVLRNADLCKGIVRDLLAYARQRPPARSDVCVADLLADTERTLRPRANARRIELRVEVDAGVPETVFGDPDQLRQVLVNLGLNAIEAFGAGRAGLVRLAASSDAGGVRFSVTDDGPGIEPEEQARVFQAFHTSKSEGTGLGLTVAQDIVAAHGGHIALDSVLGVGSTFAFTVSPPVRLLGGGSAQ
jgi:signal transduction histidine kinase